MDTYVHSIDWAGKSQTKTVKGAHILAKLPTVKSQPLPQVKELYCEWLRSPA